MKFESVSESPTQYAVGVDYDYEHRDAEHEQDEDKKSGLSVARASTEAASIENTMSLAATM